MKGKPSHCRTLELEGANMTAAEISERLERGGLTEGLYKKLNYQVLSSSCSVKQLPFHFFGRTLGFIGGEELTREAPD